uniref:protein disulfide-isomerase n=1 Tax=Nothobranchius kuhntae TaxID=321403 RepID=A0A1A8J5Y2_NOTKU
MSYRRNRVLLSVLLWASLLWASAFVEELDDSFIETKHPDELWIIKFYTPWCTFCKQLDPIWHQIGSELRSVGSAVRVGESDATISTALAKEFRVRSYPAILMLKNDVKYNYAGPRTKDGILDFTDRVSGPPVRSLGSTQLFQHAMRRHDVMFVYVGASSELKVRTHTHTHSNTHSANQLICFQGNYTSVAEELIVHTYFFSASRDVLPKGVGLTSLPAVVVFKDGTSFSYNVEHDSDLKSWILRERFPTFLQIDSYTLYAMGESGKLVLLALVEGKHLSDESLRYKNLVEKVASNHKEAYSRSFYFGFMEGSSYIDGLIMGELTVPSLIVVNLSNDGYFLPLGPVKTERHLLDFLNGVLDGSVESLGGNGFMQRVKRFVYETKITLTPLFREAPELGCLLLSFPLIIGAIICCLCMKNRPNLTQDQDGTTPQEPSPPRRNKPTHKKQE